MFVARWVRVVVRSRAILDCNAVHARSGGGTPVAGSAANLLMGGTRNSVRAVSIGTVLNLIVACAAADVQVVYKEIKGLPGYKEVPGHDRKLAKVSQKMAKIY
ncbi:MAG: hypothetical protein HYT15_03395 [Candidatus Magasanikbacteria bacterium]|nr:hypothetical protein [Candidatus Magasanikbacteria bacterium]